VRLVPSARRLFVAASLAICMIPAFAATASARGCANADEAIAASGIAKARAAVLCLHNKVRRAHGLAPLQEDASLRRAARRHSAAMVRQHFFDHVEPSGRTLLARVSTAGYLSSAVSYTLGENIGWGQTVLSTPRAMVRAWMHSAGHRANILTPAFRDIGIGIVAGTPTGAADGGTFTTDFGKRS
jgi:uncharacterized protein YkwD